MGLFDRIFRHGDNGQAETSLTNTIKSQAIIDPNNIENAIAEKMRDVRLEDCTKIPLASVAALGAGFAQMIPSLRTVAQTITVDGMGYIPINNLAGETLKSFSKNNPEIYAGAFKRGGKSVMAQMVKVNPQTITTSTVMPIDPATIMMAAMLAGIEKKLDKLQETQESILSFLEQDKQAEIQANLNVLADTLEGYRYNWDNNQYRNNHHMKVLDIKQASEKSIVFYQSQIATAIKNLPAIHTEQVVSSGAKKLTSLFRNYRMALYLFGFSSFLESLLLENFREDYLNQIAGKVQQYNEHYQNQFSKCRDMIKSYSSGSVEKQVLGGIGNASKALGKFIASSPVLSKGPVDDWLQDSGEKLLQGNKAGTERAAAILDTEDGIGNEMFIDSIRSVESICNHTTGILFDADAIYIAAV